MSAKTAIVATAALLAMNAAAFTEAASAQERQTHTPQGQHRRAASQPQQLTPPAPVPQVARTIPRAPNDPHTSQRQHAPQIAHQPSHGTWNRFQPRPAPPQARHIETHRAPAHSAPHHTPRHRSYGWRPWGYGAAAAGAVIVGTAIARSPRTTLEACAGDFRSFDWDSGTIVNRYGETELCPYLEPTHVVRDEGEDE